MDMNWDTAISALAGSGVAVSMAKLYMQKCLKDLATALDHISVIKSELSAMAVKLQHADKDMIMLHEHDRKIAALEAVSYGKKRNSCDHNEDINRSKS